MVSKLFGAGSQSNVNSRMPLHRVYYRLVGVEESSQTKHCLKTNLYQMHHLFFNLVAPMRSLACLYTSELVTDT